MTILYDKNSANLRDVARDSKHTWKDQGDWFLIANPDLHLELQDGGEGDIALIDRDGEFVVRVNDDYPVILVIAVIDAAVSAH